MNKNRTIIQESLKGLFPNLIEKAIVIATHAHTGQLYGQEPYILHPMRVFLNLTSLGDVEVQIAGLLHDVLEDSYLTSDDLLSFGMPERTVKLVEILTHDLCESYGEYILRISKDPDASLIKRMDINDNMKRLNMLPEPRRSKLEDRYKKAMTALWQCKVYRS